MKHYKLKIISLMFSLCISNIYADVFTAKILFHNQQNYPVMLSGIAFSAPQGIIFEGDDDLMLPAYGSKVITFTHQIASDSVLHHGFKSTDHEEKISEVIKKYTRPGKQASGVTIARSIKAYGFYPIVIYTVKFPVIGGGLESRTIIHDTSNHFEHLEGVNYTYQEGSVSMPYMKNGETIVVPINATTVTETIVVPDDDMKTEEE